LWKCYASFLYYPDNYIDKEPKTAIILPISLFLHPDKKVGEIMSEPLMANPRVGWRAIAGHLMAFNCDNNMVSIWSDGGGQVWEGILDGKTAEAIASECAPLWEMSPVEALSAVTGFITEVKSDGYILGNELSIAVVNDSEGEDGVDTLLTIEMMAIEHLTPFAVTFETTYACNECCIHCYMDRGLPARSFEEIVETLDALAEAGTLFVSFTGGEFFCRNDALEIVEEAHKRHFVIDILTNGTLITSQLAKELSKRTVRRVQVSLYGSTAMSHDHITGVPGSFVKTLEGVRHLTNAGIKVEVAYPMMRINFDERYEIEALAAEMGAILSPSPIITARNDGNMDTYDLRITDEQFAAFYADKDFSRLYSGRKAFAEHQFYFGFSDILDAAPCYSGSNCCAISPSGKVFPCNQMLLEVGDLKVTDFKNIWKHSPELATLRSLKLHDLSVCSKCNLLSSCARCPGLAILEGEDIFGPSPENCRQAKIYQQGLEMEV